MNYLNLLQSLMPPETLSRKADASIQRLLQPYALSFEGGQSDIDNLLTEFFPATSSLLLSEWEQEYGLDGAGSYSTRINTLMAKIRARGGLSIPYFTALTAAMGYTTTVSEHAPFTAAISHAGDYLLSPQWHNNWTLNILETRGDIGLFTAGRSAAGDPLGYLSNTFFEAFMLSLKPAHTRLTFNYLGG